MRVNNVWQKHAMKKHISISILQTWHLSHEEFQLWDFNISFSHYDTKNFIYCNKGNFSHKVENICYKSVHPKNQKKKPCLTICDQLAQVCSKKKYYRKFQVLIAQKCPWSFLQNSYPWKASWHSAFKSFTQKKLLGFDNVHSSNSPMRNVPPHFPKPLFWTTLLMY